MTSRWSTPSQSCCRNFLQMEIQTRRYAVLLCLLAMMVALQVVAAQAEAAPSPTKKKNISEHGACLVVCTAWVKPHTRRLTAHSN